MLTGWKAHEMNRSKETGQCQRQQSGLFPKESRDSSGRPWDYSARMGQWAKAAGRLAYR